MDFAPWKAVEKGLVDQIRAKKDMWDEFYAKSR